MELKESDIVICTVKRIEGATVFLEIEGNGQGTMTMSEVAAGRIRNLREYVAPNKKIVCKVLSIGKDHIQLSLRRVTAKERDEALANFQKEKILLNLLKSIVKNPEESIKKIKEKYNLSSFIEEARDTPSILKEIFNSSEAEKLSSLLQERKEKEKEVKATIFLKTLSETGLSDIVFILSSAEKQGAEIKYLGSSNFSISTKDSDFKEANTKLQSIIKKMGEEAKSRKAVLEIKGNK